MLLDRTSPLPLYVQLKTILSEEIQSGALKPGDAMPSEYTLCKKFGLSRYTVRRALDELVKEGIIERHQGKGTFVSKHTPREARTQQSLAVNLDLVVGVVIPTFDDWYAASILGGIDRTVRDHGGVVVCGQSHSDLDEERMAISRLVSYGVTGLIIFLADRRDPFARLEWLESIEKPVVLVDRYFPGLNIDFVGSDNFIGAYQATRYLIEQGHRKIRFLAVHALGVSPASERLAGYRQALVDMGISVSDEDVIRYEFRMDANIASQPQDYYDELATVLFSDSSYTAIFASNDLIAADVLQAAWRCGIKIPEDLSIVGFDNRPFTRVLEKPLTTVEQSPVLIGRAAVGLLMNRMKEPNKPAERTILPVRLLVRDTVAPPKRR